MSDGLHEGDNCPDCKTGIMRRIRLGRDLVDRPDEHQDYQRLQCAYCGYTQGHRTISTG